MSDGAAGAPGDGGAAAGAPGGDGAAGAAATNPTGDGAAATTPTDLLAGFAAARPAPGPAAAPSDSPIGLATNPSDSPAAARPASGLAVFADASGCGQMAFDVVTWDPVEREEATIVSQFLIICVQFLVMVCDRKQLSKPLSKFHTRRFTYGSCT